MSVINCLKCDFELDYWSMVVAPMSPSGFVVVKTCSRCGTIHIKKPKIINLNEKDEEEQN